MITEEKCETKCGRCRTYRFPSQFFNDKGRTMKTCQVCRDKEKIVREKNKCEHGKIRSLVKSVEEHLYANTVKDEVNVKIVEDHLYVNTVNKKVIVKSVEDHLYANTVKDEVNVKSVEDHLYANTIKYEVNVKIVEDHLYANTVTKKYL
jgi:hypothetical protein